MPAIEQRTFAGGELAPSLFGRIDVPVYPTALRRMRNFYPTKHGVAVNRPGLVTVPRADLGNLPRLIPFIYNDEQSYVIMMYAGKFFFATQGGIILSGGNPYYITNTYTDAQLQHVKFAQYGDIITLCHPEHPPRELTRLGHTNWTLTDVSFDRPSFDYMAVYGAPPWNKTYYPPYVTEPVPTGTANTPAKPWRWKATVVIRDSKGLVWESSAFDIVKSYHTYAGPPPGLILTDLPNNITLAVTSPATIKMEVNQDPYTPLPKDWEFITFRLYRGEGSRFGLVYEGNLPEFKDYGQEPDYSFGPPQERNPFEVWDVTTQTLRTEYPAVVGFYEQRRVFARTDERPDFIWASATGNFWNYDKHTPIRADDPVEFEIASRKREEIRSLVGLMKMIVLTGVGEWVVSAPDGLAANVPPMVRASSEKGSSWLDPVVVGDTVLYVQRKGTVIRDLAYNADRESAVGQELSIFASHLFEGKTVVDWAYAEDPNSILWMVMSDGSAVSFTYNPDLKIYAFARHDTANGAFKRVCTVPEGTEDAIYFMVDRQDGFNLERMASRYVPGIKVLGESATKWPNLPIFVDHAFVEDMRPSDNATTTLVLSDIFGAQCTATATAGTPFSDLESGDTIILDPHLQTFTKCRIFEKVSDTVLTVIPETDDLTALVAYWTAPRWTWCKAKRKWYINSSLENQVISILADGKAVLGIQLGPYESGPGILLDLTETFPDGITTLVYGLRYDSQLELLDIAQEQNNRKKVKEAWFQCVLTRGVWIGETFEEAANFIQWKQRDVMANFGVTPLFSGKDKVTIATRWQYAGRAALEQREPLPATIIGVIREVEFGGSASGGR